MHDFDDSTNTLADAVISHVQERLRQVRPALGGTRTEAELRNAAGSTVTADGLGWKTALRLFTDVLEPATISMDHPGMLAFVPQAPTPAATIFDLAVSVSAIYGGSWLEASGAVYAENQALAWLASLAGLPSSAGGVFVSGATIGTLSALVTARDVYVRRHQGIRRSRLKLLCSAEAHSSVSSAARVMDVDAIVVEGGSAGQLTRDKLASAVAEHGADGLFAIVATAGCTNTGVVDDLQAVASMAAEHAAWMHVDGAYGFAGLCAPRLQDLYAGIERSDSIVADPHKWLFAPFDCCALLYRQPELAVAAHTQHAGYLDVTHADATDRNPSDMAIHLTRRARGLPFWFSLATHGTSAYRRAVETALESTAEAAALIRACDYLQLVMEPQLSVILFRRHGWRGTDYDRWSEQLLRDGVAFVTPTRHRGETVARFCFISPRTTMNDVSVILASMR